MDIKPIKQLKETLEKKNITVAFAESCTGGLLSKMITDLPGSSKVFKGSCITYSISSKMDILGVDREDIRKYGAVSREVVYTMAVNVKRLFDSHIGVGISGIAGPGGATKEKPIGTVWISVNGMGNCSISRRYLFYGPRKQIRNRAVLTAVMLTLRLIGMNECA